jgi:hypothetical protein
MVIKQTTEKSLDRRLKRAVEKRGGLYIKLTYISGIPDRLMLMPGGLVVIRELKTYGKQPSKLQRSRIRQLQRLGFNANKITNEVEYLQTIETLDLL